ncbi:hypothetical protein [Lysobacter gummosus]
MLRCSSNSTSMRCRTSEFPQADHNSWDSAYATKELWPWLLAQHR